MIERELRVTAVDEAGVTLEAAGACSGCQGCAGRCALVAPRGGLRLQRDRFAFAPEPGQRWIIAISPRDLRRGALRLYGGALIGLLFGVVAGHAFGTLAGGAIDAFALIGGLGGTLLVLWRSKRTATAAWVLRPHG